VKGKSSKKDFSPANMRLDFGLKEKEKGLQRMNEFNRR
jgi:hypothetical protein